MNGLAVQARVRLLDRLLAVVGLVLSSPLLVLAGIGTKLTDPGPVIYRATRTGAGGTPFTMFKLRTMRLACDETTGLITGARDPRVSPWGGVLRRFKVDELPQLVNVARGDMAIVGPRPEDPVIVQRDYQPWMWETLEVPPGLTSPGTLDYYAREACLPDDPDEAEAVYLRELLPRKLALDIGYVRARSWRYDVKLVLRTVARVAGWHRPFKAMHEREARLAKQLLDERADR